MGNNFIVVGVDPGTTTGYAVLDLDKNILEIDSGKGIGLNHLIKEVTKHGNVLVVGTDKTKTPNLIESFSKKTGAKIISPDYDLKVIEKRKLVKDFKLSIGDTHQSDALSSAIFAINKISVFAEDVHKYLERVNRLGMKGDVLRVMLNKKIGIENTIKLIDRISKKGNAVVQEKILKKDIKEENFDKMYNKLKTILRENEILKSYNSKLKKKVAISEGKLKNKKPQNNKSLNSKIDKLFLFKEKRLRSYETIIREKNKNIEILKYEMNKLVNILLNSNEFQLLKKLDTLGSVQFETRKIMLNISPGDILLVDNPNIVSKNTLEELKGIVEVIIHIKPISRKIKNSLPFRFIDGKNISIQDLGMIAVIEKSKLNLENKKIDIIGDVVGRYQKERKSLVKSFIRD
tara:strand:+ start:5421 stop:6629 length:1209 start_codon:yes stop_codon:yes gene_type:complete